jgi:hypothetical protein
MVGKSLRSSSSIASSKHIARSLNAFPAWRASISREIIFAAGSDYANERSKLAMVFAQLAPHAQEAWP